MGALKGSSEVSSDRRQWQKIFDALVHMLKTQQTQLESLAKDRKILQDRIQIQHDRWVSDVHELEDRISQMSRDLSQAEMGRLLEAAKSNVVVGLKHREASLFKLRLEHADSDLEDLKLWIDSLTRKCSEQKNISHEKTKEIDKGGGKADDLKSLENDKEEQQRNKILEGELRKLKRSCDKLASKENAEVSALLSERNFVWNQFKKMESDYTILQKNKRAEAQHANEKIEKLMASLEQLQSSDNEKDEIIRKLKNDLATLETGTMKSNKEISRLSRELELLRNSSNVTVIPVLNRCTAEPRTRSLASKKDDTDKRTPPIKKESAGPQVSQPVKDADKVFRSSKRRRNEVTPVSETPRLFSSTFKVPKVKNLSLHPHAT